MGCDVSLKVIMMNKSVYPCYGGYGGVEKRVFHLALHLKKLGAEATILTSGPYSESRLWSFRGVKYYLIPPRVRVEGMPSYKISSIASLAGFSMNASRFISRMNFDILHSHLSDPFFYLRLHHTRPVVFQPFEEIFTDLPPKAHSRDNVSTVETMLRSVRKHVNSFCMTESDAIASENKLQTDLFAKYFFVPKSKIFTLPVGVDVQEIQTICERKTVDRRSLGVDEKDILLVSVNRIEPGKGIEYLVESMDIIRSKTSNVKLLLVGTGSMQEFIDYEIARRKLSGLIIRRTNVSEDVLYQYLAMSDIYVSPTLDVSSVQSVLEAMACGLAVVSTGQPFWISEGSNGFIVEKRNPKAIAEAVLRLLDGGEIGSAGKKSREIAERFDYKEIAKIALQKYSDLV